MVLGKVQLGDFPPPRSVFPATDPALEAVCLKAMALRPEDRYSTPRALADDLEHWLAGEPVNVFRDPWTTRLARWGRRHEWAVRSAVVASALLAILGPLIVLDGLKKANEEADRRVAIARLEAERATERANAQTERARADRASDRADLEKNRAALAEKFASFGKAQQARRDRRPGWAAIGLAALKEAAKGPPGLVTADDLRREATACLSAVDLGPGEIFGETLDFDHPPAEGIAFNRDGSRLAVVEGFPNILLSARVVVFDTGSGKALFRLRWPSGRSPAEVVGSLARSGKTSSVRDIRQ